MCEGSLQSSQKAAVFRHCFSFVVVTVQWSKLFTDHGPGGPTADPEGWGRLTS